MSKAATKTAGITPELEAQVTTYLALKKQETDIKNQLDELKSNIGEAADGLIGLFDDKDELVVSNVGKLKIMKNPPKFTYELDGKPLTPNQRAEIAELLEERYTTKDVNAKEVLRFQPSDKKLQQVLKSCKVAVTQDTRVDIKSI